MKTEGIAKWVCVDSLGACQYIFAANWDEADRKAKEKGLKLVGKFLAEHD